MHQQQIGELNPIPVFLGSTHFPRIRFDRWNGGMWWGQ